MYSQAEENYLKCIYALEMEQGEEVSTNLIASRIHTKASSVTDMLKKLSSKNLVVYKKYQGVKLTEDGQKTALRVVRKHRLWECFLVQKLGLQWDEVHEIAEQLEHIESDILIDKLDAFLRFPKTDPHGDPIPDKHGRMIISETTRVLDMKIGSSGILTGVKDSSGPFLKYLNKKNLALGDRIKVIDIESYDQSVHIETRTHRLVISNNVAENLYLKNVK